MVILLNAFGNIMPPLQYDTKHLHFFIWGARGGGEGDGEGGGGGRARGTPVYLCLSVFPPVSMSVLLRTLTMLRGIILFFF